MSVPCVRVEREDGERTRARLAEADLVDRGHEILAENGWLYVPVVDAGAVPGEFEVVYRELPARETRTMPADVLDFEPSYERLGDLVIVDEDDPERARDLADAIVESALPARAVLNRASKIQGEQRLREWEVLADTTDDEAGGRGPTETVHREYGCEFALDLAAVYFSPRLATERHRVVEQVAAGERVFDMFAGVGPYAIPIARRGAEVVGTDINGTAIEYLRENAKRNGVADSVTAIHGDVREVASDYGEWADRVVMNLPHSADEFLETALALAGESCLLHYYDIQSDDDPYGPGERAVRAAAEPAYEVTVETRRTVRSYAPHELNVVLDVRPDRRVPPGTPDRDSQSF
jgi:tRNA (guanine37-N1)-methyltransferase